MVDEIVRLPSTFRAVVAVPSEGRLRCPHAARQTSSRTSRWFANRHRWSFAMNSGELVQLTRSRVTAHGCVNLPIKGSDRALGFSAWGMHVPIPLEPWREELAWAMAT